MVVIHSTIDIITTHTKTVDEGLVPISAPYTRVPIQ